ncbi:hypothetical protein KCP75_23545 [Salmonella enterica subsp. enterica]|nr:hypothetical protein KCP75_23545 [Salmonella enterica subsp. enterica]
MALNTRDIREDYIASSRALAAVPIFHSQYAPPFLKRWSMRKNTGCGGR